MDNQKSYWPYMILGFLLIGISLGYWTVKSASMMPVQRSNDFFDSYQEVDSHFEQIMAKKRRFDALYTIEIVGAEYKRVAIVNSYVKNSTQALLLRGGDKIDVVVKKQGQIANIKSLDIRLSRALSATVIKEQSMSKAQEGHYRFVLPPLNRSGRYALSIRAIVDDDTVGFLSQDGYFSAP